MSGHLAKNQGEMDRASKLKELSESAFMGTATLPVTEDEASNFKVALGTFNRPRGDQLDFIKGLSAVLSKNVCLSDAHPLIAAVKSSAIHPDSLSPAYDPSTSTKKSLVQILSRGSAPMEVIILNGRQRVQAARASYRKLLSVQGEIEEAIGRLQVELARAEGHAKQVESRTKKRLNDAKERLDIVKKTLENIRSWPVRFYCIGEVVLVVPEGRLIDFQISYG